MRFWSSGEVATDCHDGYSVVRKHIEQYCNNNLLNRDHASISEFAFIAIIVPPEMEAFFPEIARFRKKKQEAEFRKRIDYSTFKKATPANQFQLIVEAIIACAAKLPEYGVSHTDTDDLLHCLNHLRSTGMGD